MKTKIRNPKPLQSTEQELADCVAAFNKYPKAKWFWCCHHHMLCERSYAASLGNELAWQSRIDYIRTNKPQSEQARRFRNFRPVKGTYHTQAALNREWPDNTWNGHSIGNQFGNA